MTPTFGLKTEQSRATYAELVRIWHEADELGVISDLWLFDHFVPLRMPETEPCLEAWTLLTALGLQTRRVRFGIMVAGNTYRHPAVLAKMAAALDIASDGRLEVGIGAGWHEGEHRMYGIPLGTVAQRIHALDEACTVMRSLWANDVSSFDGRFYRLDGARCEPKPSQRPGPPLTIGGTGEKLTLRVVATHADRWNFNGPDVAEFIRLNGVLDEHCRAVGRDPSTITRSVQRHVGADLAPARDEVAMFVDAGAQHVVLNFRMSLAPGVAERAVREVIEPVRRGVPHG